jgi:hypothetical protein
MQPAYQEVSGNGSSSSDSERSTSRTTTTGLPPLRDTDLVSMMTGVFPQNAEMAATLGSGSQTQGVSYGDPLLPVNEDATMTPNDADQDFAPPLLFITDAPPTPVENVQVPLLGMPWLETNENAL